MTSKSDGDTLVLSKEYLDSLSDEGCCSGSPTSHERLVLKKGPWTSAEDALLIQYVKEYGEGNWNAVQKESGLLRCGKSCRLRWANHLRPHLKKGSFSPEEEGLIVKLHSQMGNKWAHMATLLPGRTDNEIKNYWNTRVKRRQRAGLPLYPPEICTPDSDENQLAHNTSEIRCDQPNYGVLQGAKLAIPDFQFGSRETNLGPLPHAPTHFADISATGIPTHSRRSYTYSHLNQGEHVKRTIFSESSFPGCHVKLPNCNSDPIYLNTGLAYTNDADPWNKNQVSFSCSIPGNPVLSNDNFSSSSPLTGTLKMELPSLQFPETDYIDWNTSSFTFSYDAVDACIQSPKDASLPSDFDSSKNNGLLEDLVYESQTIISGKKRSFKEIYGDAFAAAETDPNSPFCPSAVSLFNECNPIISSHFDEFRSYGASSCLEETMLSAKQEPALFAPELLRPDALLGSGWFLGNSGGRVGDITKPDLHEPIPVPVSVPAGASLIVSLKSHPWISMPHALEMPEQ